MNQDLRLSLFDDGGLIVGQLTGGYSDCQGTNGQILWKILLFMDGGERRN